MIIEVSDRARFNVAHLPEGVVKDIRQAFTYRNPKRLAMEAAKIRGFWLEPRLIETWSEKDGVLSIPRGSLSKLREILNDCKIRFGVRDCRRSGEPTEFPETTTELRDYQKRIVDACLRRENCLIKSTTASGKTSSLLGFIGRAKVTTLVLVHSNALLDQWVGRAKRELGLRPDEIGILGDGKKTIRDLTIGTTKSVANMVKANPGFVNRWGALIADEVHLFAAKSFFDAVDPFPARYRIGASDDHRRKDRKDFLIEALFGGVEEEVGDVELIEGGFVMPVQVLVIPTDFEAPWYGIPTAEDDTKRPERDRLLQAIADDPNRRALVEQIIQREIAEGHQILVMSDTRDHCREMASFASRHAPAGFLLGGSDFREEFRRTVSGMRKGKIRVGVGTFQATGTGVDIPGVEVVIAATPILANRTRFRQGRGRAMRRPEGKTVARMYVTWDRRVYGLRHLANACAWNDETMVWDRDADAWVSGRDYLRRARAEERKDGEA